MWAVPKKLTFIPLRMMSGPSTQISRKPNSTGIDASRTLPSASIVSTDSQYSRGFAGDQVSRSPEGKVTVTSPRPFLTPTA